MNKTIEETVIRNHAWLLIFIGIISVFAALYFYRETIDLSQIASSVTQAKNICHQSRGYNTFLDLIKSLGIALIGFGLFGILVNTKNWREYFAERLKEVVLEQKFLDNMDLDALRDLQTRVMKAFFRDQSIDREGSFLNYFQTNLLKFISEPYREDVMSEVELREVVNDSIIIHDRIMYTCRKAGGILQEKISWRPDVGEFEDVTSLRISIKFPYNHPRKGEEEILCDCPDGTYEGNNLEETMVTCSIEKYKEIDQLIVIVESVYKIRPDRFQYWQMAYPTKNFTFLITHPKEFTVQLKPLVLEPESVTVSQKDMSSTVKCDSWMLPLSGLAWRFRKKYPTCTRSQVQLGNEQD